MNIKKRFILPAIMILLASATVITYAANCPEGGCKDPDPIELLNCLNSCP